VNGKPKRVQQHKTRIYFVLQSIRVSSFVARLDWAAVLDARHGSAARGVKQELLRMSQRHSGERAQNYHP
jgi:hypothetical protein